jgi:hypothetical protein
LSAVSSKPSTLHRCLIQPQVHSSLFRIKQPRPRRACAALGNSVWWVQCHGELPCPEAPLGASGAGCVLAYLFRCALSKTYDLRQLPVFPPSNRKGSDRPCHTSIRKRPGKGKRVVQDHRGRGGPDAGRYLRRDAGGAGRPCFPVRRKRDGLVSVSDGE